MSARWPAALVLLACATAPGCFCAKQPTPAPPAPKPVVYPLCLQASPRLNWYEGQANTLYVRIFQLSTPDGFLEAEPSRLLDPKQPPPQGVEGPVLERTVFPGTTTRVEVRQHADAQVLGLVAGYYNLTGAGRIQRPLPPPPPPPSEEDDEEDEDDDEAAAKKPAEPPCVQLGPNGIDSP
jgi:type VI secretion system VasD/TssJ family lipoprotein